MSEKHYLKVTKGLLSSKENPKELSKSFSIHKDFVLKLESEVEITPCKVDSGLDTGELNTDNQVNGRCWYESLF